MGLVAQMQLPPREAARVFGALGRDVRNGPARAKFKERTTDKVLVFDEPELLGQAHCASWTRLKP